MRVIEVDQRFGDACTRRFGDPTPGTAAFAVAQCVDEFLMCQPVSGAPLSAGGDHVAAERFEYRVAVIAVVSTARSRKRGRNGWPHVVGRKTNAVAVRERG